MVFAQGFRMAGSDRAVTPGTPFHLVSRSLTAFGAMQQIEAGNLSLETLLGDLLPDMSLATVQFEGTPDGTIFEP